MSWKLKFPNFHRKKKYRKFEQHRSFQQKKTTYRNFPRKNEWSKLWAEKWNFETFCGKTKYRILVRKNEMFELEICRFSVQIFDISFFRSKFRYHAAKKWGFMEDKKPRFWTFLFQYQTTKIQMPIETFPKQLRGCFKFWKCSPIVRCLNARKILMIGHLEPKIRSLAWFFQFFVKREATTAQAWNVVFFKTSD